MGEIVIAAGLIVSVCAALISAGPSWYAEVLAATHKPSAPVCRRIATPLRLIVVDQYQRSVSLVLIWLTGSDYGTLLTIASEMILVPYLLVGAFC